MRKISAHLMLSNVESLFQTHHVNPPGRDRPWGCQQSELLDGKWEGEGGQQWVRQDDGPLRYHPLLFC